MAADGGPLAADPGNRSRPEAQTTMDGRLPVAVIGAGPVGLAAAAHLLERGLDHRRDRSTVRAPRCANAGRKTP
jgi:hypothetical protein